LSINVCAGIVGYCFVGPHDLPHWFTGKHYRDFLIYDLSKLVEDVPLAARARMRYSDDGAPARFSRSVRDVLSNMYHDRCIGRGWPTA
jgi:hypothetical protein